ncbi:MAG: hypothetical protein E7316_10735 [Clostridiales bacterium]|nr:hypothetical protein [Clostridiales bacterium]
MKNSLSTFVCVLLTIALVAGAVCLGAVRGWNGERDAALNALSESGALGDELQIRAMDAANLAVVADRHLNGDADVAGLRKAYQIIAGGKASADELAQANADISAAAANLAEKLPELESVKASARDQMYISTLTRVLSESTGSSAAYSTAVEDYNARLSRSLTGKLAMLLGVQPLAAATGGN